MEDCICRGCGRTFAAPAVYWEDHGGAGERWGFCPHCGSDDWEETAACARCGQAAGKGTLVWGLCAACREETLAELGAFLRGLSPAALAFMDAAADGVSLTELAQPGGSGAARGDAGARPPRGDRKEGCQ